MRVTNGMRVKKLNCVALCRIIFKFDLKLPKMKVLSGFIGLVFISYLSLYSNIFTVHNKSIRALRVTANIPGILPDTSYLISNSYDILYYKNLIMYKFEYRFDSFFNDHLVQQEFRPNFFIFQKDSLFGYSYYPHPDRMTLDGRVSLDTMFSKNGFEPFKFDSTFHYKPDSLFFDEDKDLVKVYTPAVSEEYPEKFTYYLYYSKKFKGLVDAFFSRSASDEGGRKLFKIRIVAQGHYYPQYKMTLPQREFSYEMKETAIKDTAEIMYYFNRYRRDVLK